ncbi:MAG: hypothetical protein EA376_11755 [Phycisphaeraceae bacterium]|nr:MAG: hypothetical protein EA376_11755 [Phycisphaeraceae bacterium]
MLCVFAGASVAQAQLPDYNDFELQARANFSGAFNLPNSTFFTSATPSINDNADVAIKLINFPGTDRQAVWFGGAGAGKTVFTSADGAIITDVSLNDAGQIVTYQFLASPTAIIGIDGHAQTSTIRVAPGGFFGLIELGTPEINNAGVVGFRGKPGIGGQAFISDDAGSQAMHVNEVDTDPASPYSFLFSPSINNNRQIAGKARVGASGQFGNSQPDEIRLWNTDGSSVLIAVDADGDPMSPYSGFDNSVGVNDVGQVAFTASLVGGGRGVFLSDGATTLTIATTLQPEVNEIQFFSPDVNNSGLVVFRGRDGAGVETIFVGDGTDLTTVVQRGDIVPSDLGDARIDQHDTSLAFGGAPKINNNGDVAFQCGLTPPDDNQIEWGSGLYVAFASGVCPGPTDLSGDGAVGSADLAILLGNWGPCPSGQPCPADLDCDGAVGSSDLAILLGSWGSP